MENPHNVTRPGCTKAEDDKSPTGKRRLLPIEEAAAYLGLSPRTLYNGCGRRSKTPFPVRPKRIGRKLLWDVRDLDAYIDSL
ncbi:MAG: helix-turn-helix domain-containing protein [Desulfobacteraceae bacterium]|nr:helix-turn-helix domain-containing protein [Desulfobacteraceae bacterium]